MAGRKGMKWIKRPLNPEAVAEIRKHIHASRIVNCLEKLVFGEADMNSNQVVAAIALLRKVVPDLSSTELIGNADKPLTVEHVNFIAGRLLPELADRDTPESPQQPVVN